MGYHRAATLVPTGHVPRREEDRRTTGLREVLADVRSLGAEMGSLDVAPPVQAQRPAPPESPAIRARTIETPREAID
jgi:hypothetical protein